jgi:signal transduction histidine kinase/ActR/RegA family two-component response regulator
MGVPLFSRENVIGYVTLDSDKIGAYGVEETHIAQAFVNQAATAIQNAQLFAETQRLLGQTREQTQLLQQIMNIVPNGIVLLNSAKRPVLSNQAGEAFMDKIAEMTADGRIKSIGSFTIDDLYQPNPSSSPWQEIEFPEGQLIFEAAVWSLDRSREENYQVLVLQDITEERSKQSYRAAQERLAIVGQLAAGIAHDFNNIMAVILLYTQLLLQMPDLPPKEEKRLVTIYEQSQRASDLIHQILDFSRQSLLERNLLNLTPFLKELTYLLKRTLPENIDVLFDYEEGQHLINGDPTRIQQIIMNLALNSKDAMPEGGTLRLILRKKVITKKSEIPLPDMLKGNWLWLKVSDDGQGIMADNLPHIFEPFFTTKPFGQGTGLGLAQVYGIVKQHEGFIDVRSKPGQGTTFSIYLPAFETETVPPVEEVVELPASKNHETILVVEDNENAKDAIVEILEMLNYKTMSASNGVEALSIFQSEKGNIDLILGDIVMPSMDGAALHAALTKIDPTIKMVMMTGYPLDKADDLILNQNVISWMQKPLHTEQIAISVYQALYETNH